MSQLNAMGWTKLAVEAKFFVSFPKLLSSETVCSSCHIHRLVCLSRACWSLTWKLQRAFELVPREMLADGGFGSCCITELTPHHLNTQSKHSWVNLLTIWSLCSNDFFGAIIQRVLEWRCGHIMCDVWFLILCVMIMMIWMFGFWRQAS